MRKLIMAVLALLMVCALSLGAVAEDADFLSQVKERGELVIATEGAWRPWTYEDEQGTLVGFDVEVAQRIAEKLGVKATFVEVEWDGIFAGVDDGRYDMAANGVEYTDERAEKYDFSVPYGYIRTALVVRGDNDTITCFEDLNGKHTANSIASTYMILAESYGAETVGVDTLDQTINMVLNGRADATLNAEVSIYDYLTEHPEANLKIVCLTEEASHVVLPVRMGPEYASFLEAVNQAIEELRDEGVLSEISVKYFGSDITLPEV